MSMPKDDVVIEAKPPRPSAVADEAVYEVEKYIAFLTGVVWLRRMAFIDRMQDRRRDKLIRWRRIVYATAALRILCCVALMTVLFLFRYSILDHLVESLDLSRATATELLIFNGIAAMITLCILVILAEFALIPVATYQNPNQVAFTYAISSVLVFLLIALGCFSGGAAVHVDSVAAVIFGGTVDVNYNNIHQRQRARHCCGAHGPADWLHFHFFSWEDPSIAETQHTKNNLDWSKKCFDEDVVTCTLPLSCCPNPKSCLDQVSKLDFNDMQMAAKVVQRMEELESKFPVSSAGAYQSGCYLDLRDSTRKVLIAVGVLIFLLCLLSTLMTVLIVAVLLYRSAVGAIDTKNFIISPTTYDPLVRFFMRLDGIDIRDDMTMTDFSIIEELKRFDIDERFGDNEDG